VLRVETPVAQVQPWIKRLDFLTLLGTAIGVKGQGLDPTAPARLREASALIAKAGRRIVLAADGGIRETTVPVLRAAGAETVVMGSLAFGAPDLGARIAWARGLPVAS
jgi:ribulose-phosphate 3-epimerase